MSLMSISKLGCICSVLLVAGCGKSDAQKEASQEVIPIDQLLPEVLVTADGGQVDTQTLDGKIIGLYFSAGWCPPCRSFTPELVKFRDKHADAFEVVLVCGDHSEAEQFQYMTTFNMSWPAVPYASPHRDTLAGKFRIRGIPALIILDSRGKVLSRDGRRDVLSNPNALAEWKAKSGS